MNSSAGTLLVCAAPALGQDAFYARLIERFDSVVAVDAGALLCLRAGRIPDLLIGDLDSIGPDALSTLQEHHVEQVLFPVEKDVTDLDLALGLMDQRGVRGVTVTAAWHRRLDHTLAAVGSVSRHPRLLIDLADPRMNGWVLESRARPSVHIQGMASTVSVFALEAAAVVSCAGMRYRFSRDTLTPLSSWGLSNVVVDPTACITVHEGSIVVLSEVVGETPPACGVRSPG